MFDSKRMGEQTGRVIGFARRIIKPRRSALPDDPVKLRIFPRLFRAVLSRKIETSFLLVCVLGAAAGIALYWADYFVSLRSREEEPAAYVKYRDNISQRLSADRVLWDRLDQNTAIYRGDTVRTGDFSETAILFANNESLVLAENTGLIIHEAGKSADAVELSRGSLSAVTDRFPLTVFSGDNKFDLESGSAAEFRAASDGGFAVNLFRGSGLLNSGKQKNRHVNGGEALFSGADGTISGTPMVLMLNPEPGERILNSEPGSTSVEFNWREINFNENDRIVLELAKDREFQRQFAIYNFRGAVSMNTELPPGTYYWRAYADRAGFTAASASGKMEVIHVPPPQTLSPPRGRVFCFAGITPESSGTENSGDSGSSGVPEQKAAASFPPVPFSWSLPREASSVLLEVSDNARMEDPVLSYRYEPGEKEAGTGGFYSRSFGEGTWFWRVSAVYPGGEEDRIAASPVNSFSVVKDRALESPRLIFPEAAEIVNYGGGQELFFSWESLPGAASYTILIAENKSLANARVTGRVSRNYFVADPELNLDEGNYYWTVFASDESGNNSPVTEVRPFSVENSVPREKLLLPPDNYITSSAASPDLFYVWGNPHPHPELFQIATRSDFSDGIIVEERLTGARTNGWFLPPGTYYWRVLSEATTRDRDRAKSVLIESSPMRLIVLPGFNAPGAISPGEDEAVRITEGVPLEFRWEKMPYADSYDFRLFSETGSAPLYEISSLNNTGVEIYFSSHTAGRYRWTVQANAGSGGGVTQKQSLVKSHRFTIGDPGAAAVAGFIQGHVPAGLVHAPITLAAPRTGSSLVINSSSPQQVQWSADEPLKNTRVIFSRNYDPAADPMAVVQYAGQDAVSVNLPPLGEGIWFWTVQGDSADGLGLSAASPSWFTVLARPPHSAPRYYYPESNAVIALDQLMLDRSITFRWEEVPGANAYVFSLYGKTAESHELLISSYPGHETSYVLTDLTVLIMDDYYWQVEAVTITRNGTLERRGIIEQNSFTVNIPHSEYLRIRSQGTLYGH